MFRDEGCTVSGILFKSLNSFLVKKLKFPCYQNVIRILHVPLDNGLALSSLSICSVEL